jgi:hypothetical protein
MSKRAIGLGDFRGLCHGLPCATPAAKSPGHQCLIAKRGRKFESILALRCSDPLIAPLIATTPKSKGSVSLIHSFLIFHNLSAASAHGSFNQHKGINDDLIVAGRLLEKVR